MFRVAIIGCGGIAQVHAAVLNNLQETELIACADIRPERAGAMAEKYGCRAYASMDALLDAETPDAVHLCTPHYLHAPMAKAAADRGIAVFSEKPPVISREQWALLEDAAAKVPFGVCFQNRYNPNVEEAKRLIREGVYGRLLGGRAFVTWKREIPYYRDSGWRGAWATEGGGVLINQSIHTLDLLVQLFGAPDRAETHMVNHHLKGAIEVEDTVEAYLILGGCPVLFYATTAYTTDAPVIWKRPCSGWNPMLWRSGPGTGSSAEPSRLRPLWARATGAPAIPPASRTFTRASRRRDPSGTTWPP